MIWNTAFEGTPGGGDFGSITSSNLREFLGLFKTMLSKEHTFDSAETPEILHKRGYCSVLGLGYESEDSVIENGLALVNGSFIHNNGITYTPVETKDHRELLNLTVGNPHTQYILKSSPVFGDVILDDLKNVGTPGHPSTLDDEYVLQKTIHETVHSDGVHHADESFSMASLNSLDFSSAPNKIAIESVTLAESANSVWVSYDERGHASINVEVAGVNYTCGFSVAINSGSSPPSNAFGIWGGIYTGEITCMMLEEVGV